MYWVNTKKYCGAVSVDSNGKVSFVNTAPCYMWAANKSMTFTAFRKFLIKRQQLLNIKKV
jgi:hypothetical protein